MYDWEGGEQGIMFGQDGLPIHHDVNSQVQDFVWETISEAYKYSNRYGESIPAEHSLLDFFREKVQQTEFSAEMKDLCLEACKVWGSYVGDQIDRQSLKFFRLEECVDGSKFS